MVWSVSSTALYHSLLEIIYLTMVNGLKFWTLYSILSWPKFCFFMQFFLKILSGMVNSVDPDQEKSDLGLHCLHMPFCQTFLCTKF